VGDFNNDTIPDVIQPFETERLLYPGRADGSFAPGKPCGVFTTKGGGAASVGDFDGDGALDVLVAGTGGVCVFHTLRTGRFAETLAVSGEVAYKGQPFASGCGVGDFNSDGRQDLFLTYSDGLSLLYFNRGFRSFGEAPHLEGKLNEISPDKPGVDAAVLADLDGDGAEDLVAVLPNGEIWCGFNDLGGEARGLKVRLGPGLPAGPVTVAAWHGKRLLGARQAFRHARPALVGVEDTAVITLKWQLPGRPAQQRKVPVEDSVVDVVIQAPAKAK
jgi:hypothetical protein